MGNCQEKQTEHAERKRQYGVEQQQPKPKRLYLTPVTHGVIMERDYNPSKTCHRHCNLRGRAKSRSRFHGVGLVLVQLQMGYSVPDEQLRVSSLKARRGRCLALAFASVLLTFDVL